MNNKTSRPLPSPPEPELAPSLVFAPLAWLKLQFFLHAGDTEIGGFGISDPRDLLHIQDFVTLRQDATSVTVEFDDAAVADFFDTMVDRNLLPRQFARIWIHTHPGASAQPSAVDEQTLERVFGRCDWSIMFIIARSGQIYARLRFNSGPRVAVLLPVRVDWQVWPPLAVEQSEELGRLIESWAEEYVQNVHAAAVCATRDKPAMSSQLLEQFQEPGWELQDWQAVEAAELMAGDTAGPQLAQEGR